MAYISIAEEKEEYRLKVKNKIKIETFPMTNTKMGNCFYISCNNPIIKSLDEDSYRLIKNEDRTKSYKIRIGYYSGNLNVEGFDAKKMISQHNVSVSFNNNNQLVLPWDTGAIKKMFPFSEAIRVLGDGEKLGSNYIEEIGICPIAETENAVGGWLFFPAKTVNIDKSTDEGKLADILCRYGKKEHLSKNESKENSNSKRNHAIVIEHGTRWYNAEEYVGDITTWENCIYTLASDPDENGVCKVYIGEASNPKSTKKTRISIQNINGTKYIDHTPEEAKEHKFTRFRIDKLKDSSGEYLHDMQDAMIGISSMLVRECPSGYIMTNKAQGSSFNKAINEDKR